MKQNKIDSYKFIYIFNIIDRTINYEILPTTRKTL
jgi:hypothetical protein